MSNATWTATTLRLPADGQSVLVKTAHGTVEHRVIFRAGVKPRWENQHFISELDLYEYWRPLPPERKRPASDAHVAAP
jgi:hypothetical protein